MKCSQTNIRKVHPARDIVGVGFVQAAGCGRHDQNRRQQHNGKHVLQLQNGIFTDEYVGERSVIMNCLQRERQEMCQIQIVHHNGRKCAARFV